jgi:hypothetical protein
VFKFFVSQVWNFLDLFCAIDLEIHVSVESGIVFTFILWCIYHGRFLVQAAVTLHLEGHDVLFLQTQFDTHIMLLGC